ncbi:unnamed protein product, partial [Allacma fusca]
LTLVFAYRRRRSKQEPLTRRLLSYLKLNVTVSPNPPPG